MTKEQPEPSEQKQEVAPKAEADQPDTSAEVKPASGKPTAAATGKQGKVRWQALFGILLLMLVLGALTLGGHNYQQLQEQAKLDNRMQTLEQSLAVQGQARSELQREMEALLERERGIWQQQQQLMREELAKTGARITQLDGHRREDWLLAEAEYLLRLANQRLLVEGDVKSATVLLINADQVVRSIDDYSLLKVREALQQDLVLLRAVPEYDLTGAYLQLSALADQIALLPSLPVEPFAATSVPESNAEKSTPELDPALEVSEELLLQAQGLALEAWGSFAGLYRINSNRDEPVQVLMTPNEEVYLRQNLRLMLEQAQLALLQGRQPVYEQSLAKAQLWLERYFQRQPATEALQSQLETLATLQINPELPEIGRGLKALKTHLEALYRASLQLQPENSEKAAEATE